MFLAWRKWLKELSVNRGSATQSRKTRQPRAPRAQIALEILECRITPSVFPVTNLNDSGSGSLRQAIISSNSAGGANQITFSGFASNGAITLTSGALPSITDTLEIIGPGSSLLTVSGGESSGVFAVGSAGVATISGLAIVQGSAGASNGGGVNNAGNLMVDGCTFISDSAAAGGAIENTGTLSVSGCTFSGDSATSTGGAIDNNAGTFAIQNSTFSGNSAATGGGVAADSGSGSPLSISDSTFSGNSATNGGGVSNSGTGLAIIGSTLSNNTATGNGGGLYNTAALKMTLSTVADNSLVISSTSGAGGGGIYTGNSSTLAISSSDVASNSITYSGSGKNGAGAGIDVSSGTVDLLNSIVIGNTLGTTATASDVSGTLNSSESHYDMIGTGGAGGLTNGSNGNQTGVSLSSDGLMNLGSYGGPTQTIGVMPATTYSSGSPAQSAGTNVFAKTTSSISANQALSTFTVNDATYLAVGMNILIGSEQMTIAAVSGTSITASRSGSGPSHGSGASIGLPTDQRGMVRTDGGPTDIGAYEFTGFSPSILESAYGISSLPNFNNSVGDNGAGQTIALIDMYEDPYIESDLTTFDEEFGLPAPPSFEAVSQTGGAPTGGADPSGGWEEEESLDVEWAHALAPMANILVVECATNLDEGADWAATPTTAVDSQTGTHGGGATVVSMSFTSYGGYAGESTEDSNFSAANFPGVTFLSGTGDNGEANNVATVTVASGGSGYSNGEELQVNGGSSPNGSPAVLEVTSVSGSAVRSVLIASGGFYTSDPGNPVSVTPLNGGGSGATFNLTYGNQAGYPADSPDVVAVGGTTLAVTAGGAYSSEGVWNGENGGATGGGVSDFETAPSYQQGLTIHNGGSIISAGGMRATPDVSFNADPASGVPIYDSYGGSSTDPAANWGQIGGTSLSTPCWAALVAIADQVRTANGGTTLTGATQTLPILYSLYDNGENPDYSEFFNDVTTGNNSIGGPTYFSAGTGFDLTTGLGSPIENNLIPALANAVAYVGAGTNAYVLQAVGANMILTDNGTQVASYPLASANSVVIDGGVTNSLTVNYNNSGALLPADLQISFEGGSSGAGSLTLENGTFSNENYAFSSTTSGEATLGASAVIYSGVTSITDSISTTHTLTLHGGSFASETYSFTNGTSGSIAFGATTLKYSAVSSIADTDTVASLSLDLPAGAIAALEDAGNAGDGISAVAGNNVTTTTFAGPTTLLTVVTAGGSSQVTLNPMDSTFAPTSGETLAGAAGDVFYLDSQAAVNSWATLDVSTATLVFNSLTAMTDAGVIANGASAGNIALDGAGTVTLTGANTYTGATTIAAGSTLQVGSNGATGALGTGAISDNGALVWDKSNSTTLNIAISGSGSLTQEGAGTLILTQSESYTGGTMIIAGSTLQIGSGGAAGVLTGAVIDLGTLIFDLTGVSTFAGVISGAGALTQGGAGTLILSAANTFTGALAINSGILEAAAVNAFGSLSTVAMVSGAELDLNGYSQTLGSLAGAGTVVDANATSATLTTGGNNGGTAFSGAIQNGAGGGVLSLVKNGTGAFTLSGVDAYTGTTTVNTGGVLQAGSAAAVGSSSDVTVASGGALNLNGFSLTVGSLSGAGVVQDASATSATLTTGSDNSSTTFSGVLQDGAGGGSLGLTKVGTGNFTLSGSGSTYSGATRVSAGTLSFPVIGNFGANSSIGQGNLVLAGGALSYTGASTSSNLNLTLTAASTIGVAAATTTLTLGGTETGAYTLTTAGPGTLAFTTAGALNNTAGITVASGNLAAVSQTLSSSLKLAIAAGASFISSGTLVLTPTNSPVTLVGGAGTLLLNNASSGVSSPDISAGTATGTNQPVTIAAAVNLGAAARYIETFSNGNLFSLDGGDLIFSGAISGTAASGLTFFGVNNGGTAPVTVLSGADSGFLGAVNVLSGEVVLNSSTALTNANSLTLDPASGAVATVYLNGNSLSIGSLSSAGAAGAVAIVNGSNTAASLTINQSASATFAGSISNGPNDGGATTTGALAVNYAPTNNAALTLTGASTYTGATMVNGGRLIVAGSLSVSSAVTVAPTATLVGNGVVGPVTVNGNLTPGGPAQLTTGSLSFGAGSTLNVALNGATPGTGYDQVVATGASGVNLGSQTVLNVSLGFTPAPGEQFTILSDPGGTISGAFNDLAQGSTFPENGQVFTISYTGGAIVLTDGIAPTITASPSDQTLIAGGAATFSAAATGFPTPSILWEVSTNMGASFAPLSDAAPYSGVSSGTLMVSSVTSAMNGYEYKAFFTNDVATVGSAAAGLTVDSAPTVTTNPPPTVAINAGTVMTLTAQATGYPTPAVQWQVSTDGGQTFANIVDGGAYSGSATPTLAITGAASLNGDVYQAVFTNTLVGNSSASTDISTSTALTVDSMPSVTTNPSNEAVNAGGNLSFVAAASGYPTPAVQWKVSTNGGGTFTNVADSAIYSGVTSPTLTITGAMQSMSGYIYQAVFSNTILGAGSPSLAASALATLSVDTPASIVSSPTNQTVNALAGAVGFTVASSGSPAPSVQWQVSTDGGRTFANLADGGAYIGSSAGTLVVDNATAAMNGYEYQAVVSNLGPGGSLVTATSAAATLTVDSAPSVTTNPSNEAVNAGDSVSFSAAASGYPTPNVQWMVSSNGGQTFANVADGAIYGGATSPTLTITGATQSMSGYIYQAVFSNTLLGASSPSTASSATAKLTVDAAAAVTSNPTASATNAGGSASFTIAAAGNPAPNVQWQVSTDGGQTFTNLTNGGAYGGAASDTLTITGATAAMDGDLYQAVVSNTIVGPSPTTDTSTAAKLTVEYGPTNPAATGAVVINTGGAASFSAAAGGDPVPSVQWQVSTDGGKTFTNVGDGGVYSDATTNVLNISGALASMNGDEYRAVFSNTLLGATSPSTAATSPSILTVDAAPIVTQLPANSTIDAGLNASFTAAASGVPLPSVQWQVSTDGGKTFTNVSDGGVYTGATANTLTVTNATFSMNGDLYQAVFSNTLVGNSSPSTATSPSAVLTVAIPNDPATSTVSLASSTLASGTGVTVTLQAKDSLGNDVPVGGQTVAFGLANPNSGGRGSFSQVIDNGNGTYTATFTGTYAGGNTITATIGGKAVTSSLPSVTVTPGAISLAQSQATPSLPSVQLGGETTITLQTEDAYGNKETTGGQSVSFQLASATGGQGIISAVTDDHNGVYTATFIGTVVGANTIDASIAGLGQAASTPTLSVTGAAFLLANSMVSVASPLSVSSGNSITVSLQAEYAKGVDEKSGGLSVAFALGSATGAQGVFTPATYVGNGLYQASFTGAIAGSNTVTATINGLKVSSRPPAIKVTPGGLSAANSLVTLSTASVKAGGTSTVTFQPRDAAGNKLVVKGLSVNFSVGGSSGQGKFSAVKYNSNGTYTAAFTGTQVGGNTIVAAIGGQTVSTPPPVITVAPGAANAAKSTLNLLPGTVVASGGSITLTLQAIDAFGNLETAGGLAVVFKMASATGGQGTFGKVIDNKNGTYTVVFTGTIAGVNTIAATINGAKVTTTSPSITVTPGLVSLVKSVATLSASSVPPGGGITVIVQAKDAGGNILLAGDLDVSFELGSTSGGQGSFATVTYIGNGKYAATFTATSAGANTIIALIGGTQLTAKPLKITVT